MGFSWIATYIKMGTKLKAADFVPVGDSTGETVSLLIHKQNAESDH
jgi:hypothetical protein